MAYYLSIALIVCGLAIAIPAFLSWIEFIANGDVNKALLNAKSIFAQMIVGSLISAPGIVLFIWKTWKTFSEKPSELPGIVIDNSPNVVLSIAHTNSTIENSIKELKATTKNDIKILANLLLDLKSAINKDTRLTHESRRDALEQVKIISEVAKKPSEEKRSGVVRNAIRVLKGIADELPNATQFVKACKDILPEIESLLGI